MNIQLILEFKKCVGKHHPACPKNLLRFFLGDIPYILFMIKLHNSHIVLKKNKIQISYFLTNLQIRYNFCPINSQCLRIKFVE